MKALLLLLQETYVFDQLFDATFAAASWITTGSEGWDLSILVIEAARLANQLWQELATAELLEPPVEIESSATSVRLVCHSTAFVTAYEEYLTDSLGLDYDDCVALISVHRLWSKWCSLMAPVRVLLGHKE